MVDQSDSRRPRDPDRAVDFLIENAPKFAAAKGQRRYLEEFRKSKKALLMNECEAKAFAAKEAYAYSHPEYIALLEGLKVAVEAEETLLWSLKAAELRVEVWRSKEASNRGTDRTMR